MAKKETIPVADSCEIQSRTIKNFLNTEIKDFATLGQQYQKIGIPVFAIPDDKLEATGIVKDQLIQSRGAFNEQFTTIANNITALLN